MKKNAIVIIGIGIIFATMFLWGALSLDEFYKGGQSLPIWYYFKSISTDKLIDLSITIIPTAVVALYYAVKKTKKTA